MKKKLVLALTLLLLAGFAKNVATAQTEVGPTTEVHHGIATVHDAITDGRHHYMSLESALGEVGLAKIVEQIDHSKNEDVIIVNYTSLKQPLKVIFSVKNVTSLTDKSVKSTYFYEGADLTETSAARLVSSDEISFEKDGDGIKISFLSDIALGNQPVAGAVDIDFKIYRRVP